MSKFQITGHFNHNYLYMRTTQIFFNSCGDELCSVLYDIVQHLENLFFRKKLKRKYNRAVQQALFYPYVCHTYFVLGLFSESCEPFQIHLQYIAFYIENGSEEQTTHGTFTKNLYIRTDGGLLWERSKSILKIYRILENFMKLKPHLGFTAP